MIGVHLNIKQVTIRNLFYCAHFGSTYTKKFVLLVRVILYEIRFMTIWKTKSFWDFTGD